ncbi:hypothetical protein [Chondromyces apiculatus]|nr:hypothetical protein [Chondromyces apiculatus]
MMRWFKVSVVAVVVFGAVGCSKAPGGEGQKEAATETRSGVAKEGAGEGSGHAGKDVKPGSHEDWCGEHGVPESQCSRCNPELIPAFKATGDWCEEHALPESQCLKCNPTLKIVRPPKGA